MAGTSLPATLSVPSILGGPNLAASDCSSCIEVFTFCAPASWARLKLGININVAIRHTIAGMARWACLIKLRCIATSDLFYIDFVKHKHRVYYLGIIENTHIIKRYIYI